MVTATGGDPHHPLETMTNCTLRLTKIGEAHCICAGETVLAKFRTSAAAINALSSKLNHFRALAAAA